MNVYKQSHSSNKFSVFSSIPVSDIVWKIVKTLLSASFARTSTKLNIIVKTQEFLETFPKRNYKKIHRKLVQTRLRET